MPYNKERSTHEKIKLIGLLEILEEKGIIENPALFCAYVKSKGADKRITSAEGIITLDTSMSYREILKVFAKNQAE